jgi:hypothetical protein
MNRIFLKDALGWGVGLWFIGYVLGIIAFMAVPANMIGLAVSLPATLITLWVLVKKVNPPSPDGFGEAKVKMSYYLKIAVAWTLIAILFDYLFLVLVFKPVDGYYKLDVYFYYVTTFLLPLIVGYFKTRKQKIS